MKKLLILALFVSMKMLANDTAATVGAGGIEFIKNSDISMDEELLKISTDDIRVDYVFTNHSAKDLTQTFAFPLPPTPNPKRYTNWDESAYVYKFLFENPLDRNDQSFYNPNHNQMVKYAPFLNFSVLNDGEDRTFNYQVLAQDKDGKDITKLLTQEKIPLSASYLTGYEEEPPLEKMKDLKTKLGDMKLLDAKGLPNWTTTTVYYWSQWFQRKSSRKIGHAYRPATGYYWMDIRKDKTGKFQAQVAPGEAVDYCIDQKVLGEYFAESENFKKKSGYDAQIRATEVHYILKTAKNWSGPIKKFRLEITPPKDAQTFFCWDHEIKKEGSLLVSDVKDFVPKRDLRIVFLSWMR